MADLSFDRGAFGRGVRSALPLMVPPVPFGLALGLIITESEAVGTFVGWASSWVLFAGSAQLVAVELLDEGAAAAVIIATIVMINARHIVYSAVVNARIGAVPGWFRLLGSYWLTDQVFAIDEMQGEIGTRQRMWTMLGAGFTMWSIWNAVVLAGVFVGDLLPDDFPVGFIVAVLFGGLMVLATRNRPGVAAAIVGGLIAVGARDLPPGTGVLIAIIVGAAVGAALERRWERAE